MTPRKRYIYFVEADGYSNRQPYYITTKAKVAVCEILKKGVTPVNVYRCDYVDYSKNNNCALEFVASCDEQWRVEYIEGKRGW
jgi:hypothetical protein